MFNVSMGDFRGIVVYHSKSLPSVREYLMEKFHKQPIPRFFVAGHGGPHLTRHCLLVFPLVFLQQPVGYISSTAVKTDWVTNISRHANTVELANVKHKR